eukprot:s820_g1.t1
MASAETQIEEIFGSLAKGSAAGFGQLLLEDTSEADRPAKQHKGNAGAGNGLGKRPRPFSNGSSRGGNNPQNQRGSRSQDHSGHIPLVKAMGRLLLRQETQLQILKQNSAWLVFLKPGQEGPMALLHRTAEAYRETSQETQLQILKQNSAWLVFLKPGQEGPMALLHRTAEAYRETSQSRLMEAPLRAILLSTLFQALLTCLQNISSQPPQQQVVKDKVWMTPDGKWNYQRWHQENQCLQVDDSRAPLDHQEVIKHVGALVQAVQRKDVIHRFNATNGISASTESTTLFMLEIGLRAPGVEQVWLSLETLSHLSALQLCGMQLKREGLKRSSLANDVQKLLQQC